MLALDGAFLHKVVSIAKPSFIAIIFMQTIEWTSGESGSSIRHVCQDLAVAYKNVGVVVHA